MNIRPAQGHEAEALTAIALEAKAHWDYPADTLESWKQELTVSTQAITSRPQLMDRGIGRALVAHALETAARGGASAVIVDADPNAEGFYLACGGVRCGEVPAPIPGEPGRVRPQLAFRTL